MNPLPLLFLFLAACLQPLKEDSGFDRDPVDADGDGFTASVDCDDANEAVHPTAEETCNGVDDDCDGATDEDAVDALTWYPDTDGDAWGDTLAPLLACTPPSGMVSSAGDCDDGDPEVHPGEEEVCDGADQDCDGQVDEDAEGVATWYTDQDGDGYGDPATGVESCEQPERTVSTAEDCDDTDPDANPGAKEICDGVDQDCDLEVDEGAIDGATFFADNDGDGYGDPDNTTLACHTPEGYVTDSRDCDDTDNAVFPGGSESCNGKDDDCDGEYDEGALDRFPYFPDEDGDSYGDPDGRVLACAEPAGYVTDSSDCDDTSADIHPGALEICDGLNNGCSERWGAESEANVVTWFVGEDAWDLTEAFAEATASLPTEGRVVLCPGTYGVRLVADEPGAVVELMSLSGYGVTLLAPDTEGPALTVSGATVGVEGIRFTGSKASQGGAIEMEDGSLFVESCAFSDNQATSDGGAIHVTAGALSVTSSTFSNNTAGSMGGAIATEAESGSCEISDSTFTENGSWTHGGALLLLNGGELYNSTFTGNTSMVGGAVHVEGSTWVFFNEFLENQARVTGGALSLGPGSEVTMDGSVVDGNTAADGGGFYCIDCSLWLTETEVTENQSSASGGGGYFTGDSWIECDGGPASPAGFTGNAAGSGGSGSGGGVHLATGAVAFDSVGCDWGPDGTPEDNQPDDVSLGGSTTSYAFESEATFSCDGITCR